MCPHEIEAPAAHSQGVARPTVARHLVLSGTHDSRAPRSTRRGAPVGTALQGPRERCLAPAGRVSGGGVSLLFQRRLAPPRALRRTSLGSGAPGSVSPLHRPAVAFGACRASAPARRPAVAGRALHPRGHLGHRRASRRPAWSLQPTSPSRASRGLPPLRMCPHEIEAPAAHSQGVARPTVASLLVHCKARNSRALGSARRDATGERCVRGPWLRCQATAGRAAGGGVSLLFQRRLAPPRALRRTSLGSSAPGHGSPRHRPSVAFGACRASAPARRPAVACGVCDPRSVSATAGRLDGLLGRFNPLLRQAPPEDCHP
jgi:hypothetical protein